MEEGKSITDALKRASEDVSEISSKVKEIMVRCLKKKAKSEEKSTLRIENTLGKGI